MEQHANKTAPTVYWLCLLCSVYSQSVYSTQLCVHTEQWIQQRLHSNGATNGNVHSHQSALEMCNLSWTPQYNFLNHSCVSPKIGCLEYT